MLSTAPGRAPLTSISINNRRINGLSKPNTANTNTIIKPVKSTIQSIPTVIDTNTNTNQEQELASLRAELTTVKQALIQSESQSKLANNRYEQLLIVNQSLSTELQSYNNVLAELESIDNAQLRQLDQSKSIQTELSLIKQENQQLNQKLFNLTTVNNTINNELLLSKSELSTKSIELLSLTASNKELLSNQLELNQQLLSKTTEIDELLSKQSENISIINNSNTTINELNHTIQELMNQNTNSQNNNLELSTAVNLLKSTEFQLNTVIQQLTTELADSKLELNILYNNNDQLQCEIIALTKAKSTVESEYKQFQLNSLKSNELIEIELNKSNTMITEFQLNLNKTITELHIVQEENQKLKSDIYKQKINNK